MKEKDHAHLSRTESDQLPLCQPILKQRKDGCWLKLFSFFNCGVTTDSVQMSGKNPFSSDKFIIVDNIGGNSSRQSFKILVGTESNYQDFDGALSTSLNSHLTSHVLFCRENL